MRSTASRGVRRAATLAAAFVATALTVAGCTPADEQPTADQPVEITFWSWLPDIQTTIDKFEAAHPEITVRLENVGVGVDQYTAIQNAVDAGTGGPDVAQMTFEAIPNFALTGALADLRDHGGAGVSDLVLPGVASLVTIDGGIYAVPQDFGPGVMYYRADVLDEAGVDVPATWDEFAAAAEAISASGPDRTITFIDPGLYDAAYMGLWQLSAEPWAVEGEATVSIDLQTSEAVQWADYWTDLNNRGLLTESAMGSDEWFRQMGEGQIATWIVGAWGLQALTGNLPDNEGLWRVAPQPVWNEGDQASSQFGGGGTVVLEQSQNKEAATTFAMWLNTSDEGVQSLRDDQGLLPTTIAAWADPAFVDEEIAYLGGQQARQIFAESAENSVVGWEWLPFQPYVNSIYADTVGQAISSGSSLAEGLARWEARIVEYAQQQGFTVE